MSFERKTRRRKAKIWKGKIKAKTKRTLTITRKRGKRKKTERIKRAKWLKDPGRAREIMITNKATRRGKEEKQKIVFW